MIKSLIQKFKNWLYLRNSIQIQIVEFNNKKGYCIYNPYMGYLDFSDYISNKTIKWMTGPFSLDENGNFKYPLIARDSTHNDIEKVHNIYKELIGQSVKNSLIIKPLTEKELSVELLKKA